jgi:hypothetical protein
VTVRLIPWQPEEEQVLRLAYGKLPNAELARLLERSANSVGQKARNMGLDAGRSWTPAEDRVLRARFPHELTAAIARDLGRTVHGVTGRAAGLGLAKSAAYMAGDLKALMRHHANTNPAMIASRIKPGNVPANKGRRMPGLAIGRMAETQFKKGRPAQACHNYVPIGTEKYMPKRKCLVRKVTDDPTLVPVMRWKPVHRLVWEAANGPVPAGHFVRFKQGQKTLVAAEITLDRLELVDTATNMQRNSFRNNYPPEVGQAIQARGLLNRAINRATRGERHV